MIVNLYKSFKFLLPVLITGLFVHLINSSVTAVARSTTNNQSLGGSSGLGPGGIGTTDGSSNLKAWWAGNKDTFTDFGCSIPAASTNRVACWLDQSGNNRHATATLIQTSPVYKSAYLNNQPVLYGTPASYNTSMDFDGTFLAGSDYTVFAVEGRTSQFNHKYFMGGSGIWGASLILGYRYTNALTLSHFGNDLDAPVPAYVSQQFAILDYTLDQTVGREIFYNGKSIASDTLTTPLTSFNGATIFRSPSSSNTYQGDIAEIIIYDRALNAVERMMVENYLSSKYSVDLDTSGGAIDIFDGDLIIRGNFDHDMAGIFSFGGIQQAEGHSAGIIVRDVDFLQDDGDRLTFAHRDPVSGNTTADLPTTGDWSTAPDPQRWLRHWYINRNDVGSTSGGTVDIIFDLDEGEMNNSGFPPTGPISNYRLLGRSGESGQFDDVTASAGATVALVGNQIQFLGVDANILGSNYTVGTLDYGTSPTSLTLLDMRADGNGGVGTAVLALFIVLAVLTGTRLFGKRLKHEQ